MSNGKKLHEALKELSWIVGKWKSICGEVKYPTMKKPVQFLEDLEFIYEGQPLLSYKSVTRHPETNNLLHLERGFLRVDEDKCTLAFVTGMNFGIATLEEGYVKDKSIVLSSACIGIMKFAKQTVLGIQRCYRLNENGELEYTLCMETGNTPLTKHVDALYEKADEDKCQTKC
ncbi:peroxynitrite isomerase THAP4-like [Anthonomus grandis grandis]|uniref:peroxynitrite isomerase THAP4-like n=1 Tax=Anthonomus grandis grandis TaxID=2921223 RepID=UPI0021660573|nr:peroxynitrite isomerase THAP4-like [Anthonomus grandis grandis]